MQCIAARELAPFECHPRFGNNCLEFAWDTFCASNRGAREGLEMVPAFASSMLGAVSTENG